jgi:hypothetical protein
MLLFLKSLKVNELTLIFKTYTRINALYNKFVKCLPVWSFKKFVSRVTINSGKNAINDANTLTECYYLKKKGSGSSDSCDLIG